MNRAPSVSSRWMHTATVDGKASFYAVAEILKVKVISDRDLAFVDGKLVPKAAWQPAVLYQSEETGERFVRTVDDFLAQLTPAG